MEKEEPICKSKSNSFNSYDDGNMSQFLSSSKCENCAILQQKIQKSSRWMGLISDQLFEAKSLLQLVPLYEAQKKAYRKLEFAYERRTREWSQQNEEMIVLVQEIIPLRSKLEMIEKRLINEITNRKKTEEQYSASQSFIKQLNEDLAEHSLRSKTSFIQSLEKQVKKLQRKNRDLRIRTKYLEDMHDSLKEQLRCKDQDLLELHKKFHWTLEKSLSFSDYLRNTELHYDDRKKIANYLEDEKITLRKLYEQFSAKEKQRHLLASAITSFEEWLQNLHYANDSTDDDVPINDVENEAARLQDILLSDHQPEHINKENESHRSTLRNESTSTLNVNDRVSDLLHSNISPMANQKNLDNVLSSNTQIASTTIKSSSPKRNLSTSNLPTDKSSLEVGSNVSNIKEISKNPSNDDAFDVLDDLNLTSNTTILESVPDNQEFKTKTQAEQPDNCLKRDYNEVLNKRTEELSNKSPDYLSLEQTKKTIKKKKTQEQRAKQKPKREKDSGKNRMVKPKRSFTISNFELKRKSSKFRSLISSRKKVIAESSSEEELESSSGIEVSRKLRSLVPKKNKDFIATSSDEDVGTPYRKNDRVTMKPSSISHTGKDDLKSNSSTKNQSPQPPVWKDGSKFRLSNFTIETTKGTRKTTSNTISKTKNNPGNETNLELAKPSPDTADQTSYTESSKSIVQAYSERYASTRTFLPGNSTVNKVKPRVLKDSSSDDRSRSNKPVRSIVESDSEDSMKINSYKSDDQDDNEIHSGASKLNPAGTVLPSQENQSDQGESRIVDDSSSDNIISKRSIPFIIESDSSVEENDGVNESHVSRTSPIVSPVKNPIVSVPPTQDHLPKTENQHDQVKGEISLPNVGLELVNNNVPAANESTGSKGKHDAAMKAKIKQPSLKQTTQSKSEKEKDFVETVKERKTSLSQAPKMKEQTPKTLGRRRPPCRFSLNIPTSKKSVSSISTKLDKETHKEDASEPKPKETSEKDSMETQIQSSSNNLSDKAAVRNDRHPIPQLPKKFEVLSDQKRKRGLLDEGNSENIGQPLKKKIKKTSQSSSEIDNAEIAQSSVKSLQSRSISKSKPSSPESVIDRFDILGDLDLSSDNSIEEEITEGSPVKNILNESDHDTSVQSEITDQELRALNNITKTAYVKLEKIPYNFESPKCKPTRHLSTPVIPIPSRQIRGSLVQPKIGGSLVTSKFSWSMQGQALCKPQKEDSTKSPPELSQPSKEIHSEVSMSSRKLSNSSDSSLSDSSLSHESSSQSENSEDESSAIVKSEEKSERQRRSSSSSELSIYSDSSDSVDYKSLMSSVTLTEADKKRHRLLFGESSSSEKEEETMKTKEEEEINPEPTSLEQTIISREISSHHDSDSDDLVIDDFGSMSPRKKIENDKSQETEASSSLGLDSSRSQYLYEETPILGKSGSKQEEQSDDLGIIEVCRKSVGSLDDDSFVEALEKIDWLLSCAVIKDRIGATKNIMEMILHDDPNNRIVLKTFLKAIVQTIVGSNVFEQKDNDYAIPRTIYKLIQLVRLMEINLCIPPFCLFKLVEEMCHQLILKDSTLVPHCLASLANLHASSSYCRYQREKNKSVSDEALLSARQFLIDMLLHHKGKIHLAMLGLINCFRSVFIRNIFQRQTTVLEQVIMWIFTYGEWNGAPSIKTELIALLDKNKFNRNPKNHEQVFQSLIAAASEKDVSKDIQSNIRLAFRLYFAWIPYNHVFSVVSKCINAHHKILKESRTEEEIAEIAISLKIYFAKQVEDVRWTVDEKKSFMKLVSSSLAHLI